VTSTDIPAADHHVALRWYRPERAAPENAEGPTLMWLHGGGWVLGNLDSADAAARTAAVLTGFDVVSVDYRCAATARFPAAVDDAEAVARWLLDQGRRVIVAGDSAGANLAAVVAMRLGAHDALLGQVLVYPAVDPTLSSPSARSFVEGPFLSRRDMAWFYDQYLRAASDRQDPRVNLIEALTGVDITHLPTVVLTVGHDPLRDEGVEYVARLRDLGWPVTWIHAPELHHGAFTQSGVLASSERRVRQVWRSVHEVFASPVDLVTRQRLHGICDHPYGCAESTL
jgi:acetyl esterase